MGKAITKEDYASVLISSFPMSYNGMISSMAMSADIQKASIMPDLVIRHMTDQYQKCLIQKDAHEGVQDESFAANTQNDKSRRDIECFNCHKKGHRKADCWAKGGGKEGQGLRCDTGFLAFLFPRSLGSGVYDEINGGQ